jgi:hypothetical protein
MDFLARVRGRRAEMDAEKAREADRTAVEASLSARAFAPIMEAYELVKDYRLLAASDVSVGTSICPTRPSEFGSRALVFRSTGDTLFAEVAGGRATLSLGSYRGTGAARVVTEEEALDILAKRVALIAVLPEAGP